MRITFFILILFWAPSLMGQVNLDSTYTFNQLEAMLQDARSNYTKKMEKSPSDEKWLADVYFLIAERYNDLANHRKSFDNYTQALQFYQLAGDTIQIFQSKREIAKRLASATLYDEAIEQYNDVLDYYRSKNDLYMQASLLFEIADMFEERGDLEQEQQYINKAIKVNRVLQDTSLNLKFLLEKSLSYERLNELDSALLVAYNAFDLATQYGDRRNVSESLYMVGHLNQLKIEYKLAIKYLTKSLEVLEEVPLDPTRLRLYRSLSDVYSRVNDYKMAYLYESKYAELNNAILLNSQDQKLNNAAVKYDVKEQKKEVAIMELQQERAESLNASQRTALYIMAGGLALLLLLIYYLVRFYTQKIRTEKIITSQVEELNKQKIRELEDKIKINSMQSMIEGQEIERERIAQDLHDSLGGLLSTIKLQFDSVGTKENGLVHQKEYQKANALLDTAVTEVRSISHNLQPSALMNLGLVPAIKDLINRFDGADYPEIDFQHYNLPVKMDNMMALSIYRIVQELFHNALKHSKAKELLLQINVEDESIIIQFEDDGIGFDINNLKRKGMGLENIQSRINYMKGTLEIDSSPGDGTSYLIHLKLDQ